MMRHPSIKHIRKRIRFLLLLFCRNLIKFEAQQRAGDDFFLEMYLSSNRDVVVT